MNVSVEIHEAKYLAARSAGLPGWGGVERIFKLPKTLDEKFFAFDKTPTSGCLLELGCGAGNLSLELANRGFDVYGVDFSSTAIAWARENAEKAGVKIDFRIGDVTELSYFSDDSFDVLYDGNCFHCIVGESRRLALSEWRRILKKDGTLFISSLCASDEDAYFPKEFNSKTRILSESGVPYRFVATSDSIIEELHAAGFMILQSSVRQESPFGHIYIHARKNNVHTTPNAPSHDAQNKVLLDSLKCSHHPDSQA